MFYVYWVGQSYYSRSLSNFDVLGLYPSRFVTRTGEPVSLARKFALSDGSVFYDKTAKATDSREKGAQFKADFPKKGVAGALPNEALRSQPGRLDSSSTHVEEKLAHPDR